MYDFKTGEIIAKAQCELPPGSAVEASFAFHTDLKQGKRYYIRFADTPEVEVCYCETYLPGVWKSRMKISWPPQGDNKNLCFHFEPEQFPFQGDNLLNTANRGGDLFCIWISNPQCSFPQTAEIRFREKSLCACVEMVFDTNLDHINIYSYQKECVKDYRLEGFCQGKSWLLAEVKDNFLRFRKHVFDPVELEGIRIVVTSTRGAPSARICQIRAYSNKNIT